MGRKISSQTLSFPTVGEIAIFLQKAAQLHERLNGSILAHCQGGTARPASFQVKQWSLIGMLVATFRQRAVQTSYHLGYATG